MPKTKSSQPVRDHLPYNLGQIKTHLKNWKNEALDYEKRSKTHFDEIKSYVSKHMTNLNSDQVIDLYDSVSRALDQIEKKNTGKIARLDNFITSLVEDRNLDNVSYFKIKKKNNLRPDII